MKQKYLLWALPVIVNIMAFMKRFLYNSILLFFVSFVVFFVFMYIDLEKKPNFKRCWNIMAVLTAYVSTVLYLFNTETMSVILQILFAVPVAAGIVMMIRTARRSESHIAAAGTAEISD